MPRVYPAMPDRYWAKVDRRGDEECWEWTGATSGRYGRIRIGADVKFAHRVALELLGVELLPGLHVDHLCENTLCVNPLHLEPVTCAENILRSREIA